MVAPSDYIAYFDETGDHGLDNIDPAFPVFVLCGWVFKIEDYLHKECPAFCAIKFNYFGHDALVFHSRDIRKRQGAFQILTNNQRRSDFMADISDYFESSSGTLIAAGINKTRLTQQYAYPNNPYSMSLLFCLERIYAHLRHLNQTDRTLTCVFEERGKAEDKLLAMEFTRICAGDNQWGPLPFQMVFANKLANMPGLQVADLAAYPIARKILNPKKSNPAYDSLRKKVSPLAKRQSSGLGLEDFSIKSRRVPTCIETQRRPG
jgi:hypothetical protein